MKFTPEQDQELERLCKLGIGNKRAAMIIGTNEYQVVKRIRELGLRKNSTLNFNPPKRFSLKGMATCQNVIFTKDMAV